MKRAATGGRGLRASASIACARVAACCLWAALALPAVAGAAPLGVTGEIVNPPGGSGLAGGEFSTASGSPGGVAVNDASGEIYTVSASANRVQRFDSSGNFISAFGADVISGAAAGTGTLNGTATVSAVVATSGAFLVGQKITGAGIPAGTRIVAANVGTGLNSTLTLSQAATASASGVALTVAAEPNNVPANELQTITVTASGGNFKLQASATQGFAQATSENIPHDAPVATVQSELEALPQIGAGNVEVTGAPGEYTVEYKGARADTDIAVFVVAGSPALSGGAATRTTVVEGGGAVELCTMASECKPGVGGSS
ncbi:MAG TPA: hypothetical protein VK943_03345, partial [Arenibaculum sp.]|nr:hypothetical protein [Arenibaculum sp.]